MGNQEIFCFRISSVVGRPGCYPQEIVGEKGLHNCSSEKIFLVCGAVGEVVKKLGPSDGVKAI